MPPSLFASRPLSNDRRPSPPKSRLKSFSAFLSNPFGPVDSRSTTNSSFTGANYTGSAFKYPTNDSLNRSPLIPSAPIPYFPPKSDNSLTNLSLATSPFRVYIRNEGLPSCSSTTSVRSTKSARSRREVESDFRNGLPSSHYPLAGLSIGTSGGEVYHTKPFWKEMPTLASAINITDSAPPASSTFGPSRPLVSQPQAISSIASKGKPWESAACTTADTATATATAPPGGQETGLPRSTSKSSSMFQSYRIRRSIRRSSSRSSTKQEDASEPADADTGRPIRMSRRLSFDNILGPLATATGSSSRRKNKDRQHHQPPHGEELIHGDYRRWSTIETTKSGAQVPIDKASAAEVQLQPKVHRLALPPMRSLRNRFSVGAKSGKDLMAVAKADVAARKRIHEYDNLGNGRRVALECDRQSSNEGPPIAAGTVAEGQVDLPQPQKKNSPVHPAFARKNSSLPHNIRRNHAHTSQRVLTPGNALQQLLQPSESDSRREVFLSPAQDDKSIVDPYRSPLPIAISTEALGSPFPPLPSFPSPPKSPMQSKFHATTTSSATTSPSPSYDGVDEVISVQIAAKRQQSLSELRLAFTRMKDISGLDVSSQTDSLPPSRRESEIQDNQPTAETVILGAEVKDHSRPFLDLGVLDEGLQAIVNQNLQCLTGVTAKTEVAPRALPGLPSTSYERTGRDNPDNGLPGAQSGRSWHTAQEECLPISPPRGLPRSRSKSTHDLATLATLATLASGKDLVGQIERIQGEGWWSAERPRSARRRASNIEHSKGLSGRNDEEEKRIETLEQLAKITAIPHRSRMPQPEASSPGGESPCSTPSRSRPRPRPQSALAFRREYPRTTIISRTKNDHQVGHEPRPSTVQPRIRSVLYGPRPSLVAGPGSMCYRERRGSLLTDGTPTRASATSIQRGPFITSKISPDIARRASCLTRGGVDTPIELAGVHRRSGPNIPDLLETFEKIKEKHAVELEAIIDALSMSKSEVKTLRSELEGLRRTLGEKTVEKEGLHRMVNVLEGRVRELSGEQAIQRGKSTRGRSLSVTSMLLPDLTVPVDSLVLNVSPLAGACSPDYAPDAGVEVHRFERTKSQRNDTSDCDGETMRRRPTSETMIYDTSTESLDDDIDRRVGVAGEWTLKLRRADERHLDDM